MINSGSFSGLGFGQFVLKSEVLGLTVVVVCSSRGPWPGSGGRSATLRSTLTKTRYESFVLYFNKLDLFLVMGLGSILVYSLLVQILFFGRELV